jgi:hypothetical protein
MLRQATRTKAKIRLGLSAVSGGGKTYSAILIAKGLSKGDLSKVAIIDTENGSADLYAHMGNYNVLTLNAPFSPERYIDAIKTCEDAGINVIIIDSITHEWDGKGGCLQIQEQLGGKYQDWAKVTPRHQAFIDAILQSKCHMITTVRRKQDYEMTKDSSGKMKVEKAGLKEVTREGFEYELTANIELDIRHNATALKDRTGLFMDQPQFIPSEETGKKLLEWCESGTTTTAEKVELIKTKLDMEEIPAWFLTPAVKKEIHDLINNSTLSAERQTVAKKSLATCLNDKMVNTIRQALFKFQN